jgi:hypothetical protein
MVPRFLWRSTSASTMAAFNPSSSFGDPDWIPGYENLTPAQRYDALNKSKWIEEKLIDHVQQLDVDYLKLGERINGDVQWILEYGKDDGVDLLEFRYRRYPGGTSWCIFSASVHIFVRSLVSGQYENLTRFRMSSNPGCENWVFTSDSMREKLGELFTSLLLTSESTTASTEPSGPIPSLSYDDPGWIPGFVDMRPQERVEALRKSMWIEENLWKYMQQLNVVYLKLGEGTAEDISWILECEMKDRKLWITFRYRILPRGTTWYEAAASMRVFVRTVAAGQYEFLQRFVHVDDGFKGWLFISPYMRETILEVFDRLLSTGQQSIGTKRFVAPPQLQYFRGVDPGERRTG